MESATASQLVNDMRSSWTSENIIIISNQEEHQGPVKKHGLISLRKKPSKNIVSSRVLQDKQTNKLSWSSSSQPSGCHVPYAPRAVCHGQRWTALQALVQSHQERQPCHSHHRIRRRGRCRCGSHSQDFNARDSSCGLQLKPCFLFVTCSHHGFAVWPGRTGGFDVHRHPVCLHTRGFMHLDPEVIHVSSFFFNTAVVLTQKLDCCSFCVMKVPRGTDPGIRHESRWYKEQVQPPKAAIISQFDHLSNRHNLDCSKWCVRQTAMVHFTFLSFFQFYCWSNTWNLSSWTEWKTAEKGNKRLQIGCKLVQKTTWKHFSLQA